MGPLTANLDASMVLVTGRNGAGKSLLGRLLVGLSPGPTDRLLTTGQALLFGEPLDPAVDPRRRYYLPQAWEVALIGAVLGTDFRLLHSGLGLAPQDLRDAMRWCGLDPEIGADRAPASLSRGERQLVALAIVKAIGPQFAYLDEPDGFLDEANLERLPGLVADLLKLGCRLAVATHEPELYSGLSAAVVELSVSEAAPECADDEPELLWNGDTEVIQHQAELPTGQRLALRPLQYARGGLTALTGPNGAGKTTLLRWLARDGRRSCLGWAESVVLIGEDPNTQLLFRRVPDELEAMGVAMPGANAGLASEVLAHILQTTDRVHELSYGQRRLMLLLCGVLKGPDVLLVDEPEAGLSRSSRNLVRRLLGLATTLGTTTMVALNRQGPIQRIAHCRSTVTREGRRISTGISIGE